MPPARRRDCPVLKSAKFHVRARGGDLQEAAQLRRLVLLLTGVGWVDLEIPEP
jgi:hypothetical protein